MGNSEQLRPDGNSQALDEVVRVNNRAEIHPTISSVAQFPPQVLAVHQALTPRAILVPEILDEFQPTEMLMVQKGIVKCRAGQPKETKAIARIWVASYAQIRVGQSSSAPKGMSP
jgi:hypothetical protein